MSYTYAILHVSEDVYTEIRQRLLDAGYGHAIDSANGEVLDMHGIALQVETDAEPVG